MNVDFHEEIDVPSIQELFVYYDNLYFGSTLGTSVVEWSPRKMTRCGGICYPQPGGGCIIRLSEPLLRLRPSWELKNTLIHEMIHAWLIGRNISEGNGGHGRQFNAKCQEINASIIPDFQRPARGYNITVYHSMTAEVEFYQQHHWTCNICQKTIKRAMNRKPQPADCREYSSLRGAPCSDPKCGYHLHKRLCPHGEFIKVKEPDGFSDKSKKRSNMSGVEDVARRKRGHTDKTKPITDFFKGSSTKKKAAEGQAGGTSSHTAAEVNKDADDARAKCKAAALGRIQDDSKTASLPLSEPSGFEISQQADIGAQDRSDVQVCWPVDERPGAVCSEADKIIDLEAESSPETGPSGHVNGLSEFGPFQFLGFGHALNDVHRPPKSHEGSVCCPVCSRRWSCLSNLELNQHIDACLQNDIEILD